MEELESFDYSEIENGCLVEDLELLPVGSFLNIPMFRIDNRTFSAIELEEVAVNSAGGAIGGGAVQPESPNIKGYDKPLGIVTPGPTKMFRRKSVVENRDSFLGKNIFELDSEDYYKCMNGRTHYERWVRKSKKRI